MTIARLGLSFSLMAAVLGSVACGSPSNQTSSAAAGSGGTSSTGGSTGTGATSTGGTGATSSTSTGGTMGECLSEVDCNGKPRPADCPGTQWSCDMGACVPVCACGLDEAALFAKGPVIDGEITPDGRLVVRDVTDPQNPISLLERKTPCPPGNTYACGLLDSVNKKLEAKAQVVKKPGGIDVQITIANKTGAALPFTDDLPNAEGSFTISGIDAGRVIHTFDFTRDTHEVAADMGKGCRDGFSCSPAGPNNQGVCVPSERNCDCVSQCANAAVCKDCQRCSDWDNDGQKECNFGVPPAMPGGPVASCAADGDCAGLTCGQNVAKVCISGQCLCKEDCLTGGAPDWEKGASWNSGAGAIYPDDLYSPVDVIRQVRDANGKQYTLGVSVIYPVIEDAHPVVLHHRRAFGESQVHLAVKMKQGGSPVCRPDCNIDVQVPAGATRTYTVALRFVPEGDPWQKTLVPYRNYLRDTYGPVTYARDPRPLLSLVIAGAEEFNAANPRGYHDPNTRRPDMFGWKPWADAIRDYKAQSGYERVMMWAAAGMYSGNGLKAQNPNAQPFYSNYPFIILTPFDKNSSNHAPELDPGANSLNELAKLVMAPDSLQMGYYHGYASVYHAKWNPKPDIGVCSLNPALPCTDNSDCPGYPDFAAVCKSYVKNGEIELLDPQSQDAALMKKHRDAVFAEYDIAVNTLGAKEIGMDAITALPLWRSYPWIKELRKRYPAIKFTGESSPSDLFMLEAGGYLFGNGNVKGPHALADFLTPGHESWVPLFFNETAACDVSPADKDNPKVKAVAEQFAKMGYVVVPYTGNLSVKDVDPSRFLAVKSWIDTVPVELRDPCQPDLYKP